MTSPGDDPSLWGDAVVQPGEQRAVPLTISESYSGAAIQIVLFVWRGTKPGPTLAVTAAVHGDEINGTGTIRQIITTRPFEVQAGTLVLVPVVNMLGFERHSRYLPDRRDLNRSFPGSSDGSLASRLARTFYQMVVKRCDYCIDLHTAAIRRTNFPNVRADLTNPKVAAFARAFGASLMVSGKGPRGSLRRTACRAGCATMILEAGEIWKVEPSVVEYAVGGIRNCLVYLGMVEAEPVEPPYRIETDATKWVRATHGGFLQFHVAPGDIVNKGDALSTTTNLTGEDQHTVYAPRDGVVLGMTTLPSVAPGDPVCHLAFPKRGVLRRLERVMDSIDDQSLHQRVRGDLARSVLVTDGESDGSRTNTGPATDLRK